MNKQMSVYPLNPASLPIPTLIFQEFCNFDYCIVSSHPHKYAVIYQIISPECGSANKVITIAIAMTKST